MSAAAATGEVMSGEGEWESCCDRLPCGWFTADKTSVIPQRTQVVTGESKNLITLESREGGECVQSVEKTEALRRSGGAVGRRRKTVTCDILKLGRGCRQMTPSLPFSFFVSSFRATTPFGSHHVVSVVGGQDALKPKSSKPETKTKNQKTRKPPQPVLVVVVFLIRRITVAVLLFVLLKYKAG